MKVDHDGRWHRVCRCIFGHLKNVAVLYAYFDESYNHPNPKRPNDPLLYTVACYLSPAEQWKKFARKWKVVLDEVGIEAFHMNRYENRVGEFADWPDSKRVQVLRQLHRIISDHTIYSSAFVADRVAFDEVVTAEARRVFSAKSCYAYNAFSCMSQINFWCDQRGHNEPIHYVFAHLDKQSGDLDEFFGKALKNPELRRALRLTGPWTRGLAKDVVQLQAADILAYEVNKRIAGVFGSGEREIRKSLTNMALVSKGRFEGGYLARELMIQMMSDFKEGRLHSMYTDLNHDRLNLTGGLDPPGK